jgi:hypothetical protein
MSKGTFTKQEKLSFLKPINDTIRNINSNLIDVPLILSFTLVVRQILHYYFIVDYLMFIILSLLFSLFYHLTFFHIGKNTIGMSITGLKYKNRDTNNKIQKNVFTRIIISHVLFASLIISVYFYCNHSYVFTLILSISLLIFNFINKYFNRDLYVTNSNKPHSSLSKIKLFGVYLLFIVFLTFTNTIINNSYQRSNNKILGLEIPSKFYEYPNDDYKVYLPFLKKQKSAINYIIDLFDSNNVVVLCEANHQEINFWKFIENLVSNRKFIENVGNVFSEYGSYTDQCKLDSLMNLEIINSDSLDKAVASIMKYRNFGFFHYIKHIKLQNDTMPDRYKINHYFTDIKGMHSYQSKEPDISQILIRDSLMACIVINKYDSIIKNSNRNKCLVITNYRHSFIRKKLLKKIKVKNEAEYIYESIPKTVNIMENTPALTTCFVDYPIHNGKWEKAFIYNQRKVGFDFYNSPFGTIQFDYWPNAKLRYQDIFTGFIFINPINDRIFITHYPYDKTFSLNTENKYNVFNGIMLNFYNFSFFLIMFIFSVLGILLASIYLFY